MATTHSSLIACHIYLSLGLKTPCHCDQHINLFAENLNSLGWFYSLTFPNFCFEELAAVHETDSDGNDDDVDGDDGDGDGDDDDVKPPSGSVAQETEDEKTPSPAEV